METATPTGQDIRIYLQTELVKRCKVNPRYSLRAFANLLEIESSALSKILNGKRAVTPAMFEKISTRLALDPTKRTQLSTSIREPRGRAAESREVAAITYQQMALDHYLVMSEWYHFAILELTAVRGFKGETAWIARSLGLTKIEAQSAVERLQRIGFLEIDAEGRWLDRAGEITNVQNEFTSVALRKLQSDFLAKAIVAIEEVEISKRDHTGMTMAISEELIPEAKKRITKFRRELCGFLQSGSHKDAVFQLNVALYPLTKNLRKGTK